MPGMMDTILNLGLNDETVEGLAEVSGNSRFAWDCYRRFIQMFGDVVLGVDHYLFEEALELFLPLGDTERTSHPLAHGPDDRAELPVQALLTNLEVLHIDHRRRVHLTCGKQGADQQDHVPPLPPLGRGRVLFGTVNFVHSSAA